jgi:hypothetical protein
MYQYITQSVSWNFKHNGRAFLGLCVANINVHVCHLTQKYVNDADKHEVWLARLVATEITPEQHLQ